MANVTDIIKQLERDAERGDEIEEAARKAERIRAEYQREQERLWDEVMGK